MYQAIRRFKQLQQISLREANELNFGVFSEITAFLLQGVVEDSAAVRLYNEASSGVALDDYETRYCKLLSRDLRMSTDFSLLLERQQCVMDLCSRFDAAKYDRYCAAAAKKQRQLRVAYERQAAEQRQTELLRIYQAQSKFGGVYQVEKSRPSSVREKSACDGKYNGQEKSTVALIADNILQKLPDAMRRCITQLSLPNAGQLLYCSAEELLYLQLQLYQMETQLATQNAHIHAYYTANSEFIQAVDELRAVSAKFYSALQDAGNLPPDVRKALMTASYTVKNAYRAAERLTSVKVDVVHIKELWKGFERTRERESLFRKAVMRDTEALVKRADELSGELRNVDLNGFPDAQRCLLNFQYYMAYFLYSALAPGQYCVATAQARVCDVSELTQGLLY